MIAGFGIGPVASVMGVAGGALLIPTIVLLYGIDIKLAESLSLAVSLPKTLVAFAPYNRGQSFAALRRNRRFVVVIALGPLRGPGSAGCCSALYPARFSSLSLVPLLLSSWKVWLDA